MKKLLFATLIFIGLAAGAAEAQAGCYKRVRVGYDRCGHAIYRSVYVPSHTTRYTSHYRKAPNYYRSSDYGRRNCDRSYSHSRYSSRPRFAISFGF